MKKSAKKKPINIVLIREKTGEVVRTLRFKRPGEFERFLDSFRKMRYPGYKWKYLS